jgi:hypothetical protein
MEEQYPQKSRELTTSLEEIIQNTYVNLGEKQILTFSCPDTLVDVGAPKHLFLPVVAQRLGTKVLIPDHAEVANALGAIVGKASAVAQIEINYRAVTDDYLLFGHGRRAEAATYEEAKYMARDGRNCGKRNCPASGRLRSVTDRCEIDRKFSTGRKR